MSNVSNGGERADLVGADPIPAQTAIGSLKIQKPVDAPAAAMAPVGGGKGGEGGVPALPPSNAVFLAQVIHAVPTGSAEVVCSKPGDPSKGGWVADVARDVDRQCPPDANNYFNCSTFHTGADGEAQATKDRFSAYHVLVFDDVGTKVERAKFGGVIPTWEIETSPGNSQIGIRLTVPITDPLTVSALQKAVAAAELCDPGALGLARWVRLPNAINGKAAHRDDDGKAFRCRLVEWSPDTSYTVAELAATFGLQLEPITSAKGTTKALRRIEALSHNDDVFTPKTAESPVVAALKLRDLYKREIGPGKHDITCPWLSDHTDEIDGGTAYFEPDEAYPHGGFCCQHSHGDNYGLKALLDFLDLTVEQARGRSAIRIIPGELNRVVRAAEKALADLGGFYQSGGAIVAVRTDSRTGDITTELVTEGALTTALAEATDWLRYDTHTEKWQRIDPPVRIVQLLLKAQTYGHLPNLTGLSRQPYFRETDGELVLVPGYDLVSGRYAAFDPAKYVLPEPTFDAARSALAEINTLLAEFKFASEADRAATIAAMLTGAVRPSLPTAPAFNITASTPGSGKSYLSSAIVPFAGPGIASKVSYPTTTDEATKSMLSLLIQAPAAVVFDDMQTQWIPFGAINRMLTSDTITDRVLGVSRTVTVPTRTLFLGTGNNVGPVQDMTRRVITIRLAPLTATPATLSYAGRPAEAVKAHREHFVGLALTIIRAHQAAGSSRADVCSIASYDRWDQLCRQPLLWLGMQDPATSLIEQVSHDPDQADFEHLLTVWYDAFGDKPMTLREVMARAQEDPVLQEALLDLPGHDRDIINRSKLGWFFKRNENRIVGRFAMQKAPRSERTAWRVVIMGPELGTP